MSRREIETRIYTSTVNRGLIRSTHTETEVRHTVLAKSPVFHFYSDVLIAKQLIDSASSWADVIILDHGTAAAEYSWRRHGLPCVPFFHYDKYDPSLFGALGPVVPIYTFPLKAVESKCIRTIPLAFANSPSLAKRMRHYMKGGQLLAVPLGIDVKKFCPTGADEGFVLMTGRFHPANNFELGLRAASNISSKLIIAGIIEERFSWYYHRLQNLVHETPELRSRVDFLNPNDQELLDLIQKCSVFLSPRKYDYLGLATLEAMACAKPVIAYDADDGGELHSVVRCGDDLSQWRKALGTLVEDSKIRKRIGMRSLAFVESEHTIQKTVDVMLSAIQTYTGVV